MVTRLKAGLYKSLATTDEQCSVNLPHHDRARGGGGVRDKEPEPPTFGEIERVLKFFTK